MVIFFTFRTVTLLHVIIVGKHSDVFTVRRVAYEDRKPGLVEKKTMGTLFLQCHNSILHTVIV